MTANPLFYKQISVLDRGRHQDLHLAPRQDYRFAGQTNSVYLTQAEFAKAARDYPIVFARQADGVLPVAILGLRDQENLFLDEQGHWQADYIPAYVRRYPFILATGADGKTMTVCIDQASEAFNREGRGERLFLGDEQSPLLQRSVAFLRDFQTQHERTLRFAARLRELNLLEVMQANVTLPGGDKLALGGFDVVSRDRLKALDDGTIAALLREGLLESIHLHLQSLDNFQRLVQRLNRQKAAVH